MDYKANRECTIRMRLTYLIILYILILLHTSLIMMLIDYKFYVSL